MELFGKQKLLKLKKKNKGNKVLASAVDQLIKDLTNARWQNAREIKQTRPDADCIHSDGFYFFDISIHRTMVLILLDDDEATVIWAGSHDEYEQTFKNNKHTIEKWLRKHQLI
ncbi:type II toxin-antitoxin system HigB family toxin [Marinilabilia sp.]